MQQPMSNNMHTSIFYATSNIQHTPFHTSTAEQVQMSINNYHGQTNMVSLADLYEAPYANNFSTIQQGVSHIYSSPANSQYLPPSQSMLMNVKIGHADFSYLANYSRLQVLFLTLTESMKIQRPCMHLRTLLQQGFHLQNNYKNFATLILPHRMNLKALGEITL